MSTSLNDKYAFVDRKDAGRYCTLIHHRSGKEVLGLGIIIGTRGGTMIIDDGREEYGEFVNVAELGISYNSTWDCEFIRHRILNKWIWDELSLEEVLVNCNESVRELAILFKEKWK